ncbi:MAG TPA: hypothetical protein PKX79_03195 [Spirochaetota bacterium]|jgi:hypothetical protein|nr:hypothetical protein [Spirochaetota bacterium]HOK91248.1 hypothetical protein [Spirochaetota bacterium]HPD77013.1 hypothetical protein [Spirochaetota bacterium]HPP94371.1 hypothetical protein [Spirochaetota bacterium]HRS63574.1 hypothetical protein [Spirochaetota bacterium]
MFRERQLREDVHVTHNLSTKVDIKKTDHLPKSGEFVSFNMKNSRELK